MFGKAMNFDSKRVWDAFTYYIVQTVVLVGVATTLVYGLNMFGVVHESGSFFAGGETYRMIGSCFVLLVASGILYGKGLSNDMFAFAVTVAAIWLAWHNSVMLGMVPVALLSTFDSRK